MGNTKRTVLITGATGGLGTALVKIFASCDWNVVLHKGRRDCDLTTIDGCQRLCRRIHTAGGIDVLINNAAVYENKPFTSTKGIKSDEMVRVNLLVPMTLTRTAWPWLRRSPIGTVVFINSAAGKRGAPGEALYCATKFGLRGFAQSLQYDATQAGVHVISVFAGAMHTKMTAHRQDHNKLINPFEVAGAIYSLCTEHRGNTMRVTEVDIGRTQY